MIDDYDLKHPGKVCSFRKRPHGRRNDDEKSHLDGLMVHQCDGNEKDVSWNTFLNRMLAEDFLPCRAAWTISVMERKQIRQRSPRISFMRNYMFWQAKRVMCRDNPFFQRTLVQQTSKPGEDAIQSSIVPALLYCPL